MTAAASTPVLTTPDAKREAILDAALTLFSERTFDGTPVPLIADTAGVAAGTIYRYYPSKEALVNALFQRWKGKMQQFLANAIVITDDPQTQFGRIWRGLWRFGVEHPRAIAFLETHHHSSYLDDESRALAAQFDAQTRAFVQASQASGAVRDADPAILIALVMGAFTGIVKCAGPDGLQNDETLIAQTEQIMWAAVSRGGVN